MTCKECGEGFSAPTTRTKYCSVSCRNKFHWKQGGTKYRNSDKGKQTMFEWRLKTCYGITLEQYNRMLEDQSNSCAICERPEPTGFGWHVDHCHKTHKVRGLLCSKCNQALGMFEDNTTTMKKAITYLENS